MINNYFKTLYNKKMKLIIPAILLTIGSCIHAQIYGEDLPVPCIKYCKNKKCEC